MTSRACHKPPHRTCLSGLASAPSASVLPCLGSASAFAPASAICRPNGAHDPIAPALSPRHHAPYVRTIMCYDTHCSCCAPACHAYRNIIIRSGPQCVIFIVLVLLPQYAFASIRICIRLCVFASCLLVGCCLDRSPLPSLSHSLSLSLSFAGPLVCPILPMRSGEGARLAYQWRFVA